MMLLFVWIFNCLLAILSHRYLVALFDFDVCRCRWILRAVISCVLIEKVIVLVHRDDEDSLVFVFLHYRVVARRCEMLVAGTRCRRAGARLWRLQIASASTRILRARHHDKEAEQRSKGRQVPDDCQRVHSERLVRRWLNESRLALLGNDRQLLAFALIYF